MKTSTKVVTYCITCRNRLHHIRQTLMENIVHNGVGHEYVEFLLLDYNSNDGLAEWIKEEFQSYIDKNILVYYRTNEPQYYLRCHSRNMAFRLASGSIVCNLDADNYLGEGFSRFLIDSFKNEGDFFYTPRYLLGDAIGRLCVKKEDFLAVRGYNEDFKGYGIEDIDIYSRLISDLGLKQEFIANPEYCKAIRHKFEERVSEEFMGKTISDVYIQYLTPNENKYLFLYKNHKYELYHVIHNAIYNMNTFYNDINQIYLDERFRAIYNDEIERGTWVSDKNTIILNNSVEKFCLNSTDNNLYLSFDDQKYYITTPYLRSRIISLISEINNYLVSLDYRINNKIVNPIHFGTGIVYKNFDNKNIIRLN